MTNSVNEKGPYPFSVTGSSRGPPALYLFTPTMIDWPASTLSCAR